MSVLSKASIGVPNPNEINHSNLGRKQVRVAKVSQKVVPKPFKTLLFNGTIGDDAEKFLEFKADRRRKRKHDRAAHAREAYFIRKRKTAKKRMTPRVVKDHEFDSLIERASRLSLSPKLLNRKASLPKLMEYDSEPESFTKTLNSLTKTIKINVVETFISSIATLISVRKNWVGVLAWFSTFYNQVLGISITETALSKGLVPLLFEHMSFLEKVYKDNKPVNFNELDLSWIEQMEREAHDDVGIYEVDENGNRTLLPIYQSQPEFKLNKEREGKELSEMVGCIADSIAQVFGQQSKAVTGSSLWHKFNRIGEFITIAPILMSAGFVKTLSHWNNFHKFVSLGISNIAGVVAIGEFVKAARDSVVEYFTTPPEKRGLHIFLKGDTFELWQVDVLEFINRHNDLEYLQEKFDVDRKIDITTSISRYTLTQRAIEWGKEQYKIGKAMSLDKRMHSRFSSVFVKLMSDLNLAINNLNSLAAAGKRDPTPFSFLINSIPGVMKSEFMYICMTVCASVYGESMHASNIYTRQPGVEFYNGAQHKQGIWVYDDLGQAIPGSAGNTVVNDVIGVINPVRPLLNMPGIEDKSTVTPNCKIVIATANIKDFGARDYFTAPAAGVRRFPWVFTLKAKAQFCYKGTNTFDKSIIFGGDEIDRWDILVEEVIQLTNKTWEYRPVSFEGKELKWTDIHTFMRWLGQTCTAHKDKEQRAFDGTMNRPTRICKHWKFEHMCSDCRLKEFVQNKDKDDFKMEINLPEPEAREMSPDNERIAQNSMTYETLDAALFLEHSKGCMIADDLAGNVNFANNRESHFFLNPRSIDFKDATSLFKLTKANEQYMRNKGDLIDALHKLNHVIPTEPEIKFADLNVVPEKVAKWREYVKLHMSDRVFDVFNKASKKVEYWMLRRMIKKKLNYDLTYKDFEKFTSADPNSLLGCLRIQMGYKSPDKVELYNAFKVYPMFEGLLLVLGLVATAVVGLAISAIISKARGAEHEPNVGLMTQETYAKLKAYDARVGVTESTIPFSSNSVARTWSVKQPLRTAMELDKWRNPLWTKSLENALLSNLVSLEYVSSDGLTASCQGVFISGNVLLTAGHNIPKTRIALAVTFGPKYYNAYSKTFIINEEQVVRHKEKDICLVLCRGSLPCKDLTQYFHPDVVPVLDQNVPIDVMEVDNRSNITRSEHFANLAYTSYTKPDGVVVPKHLAYAYPGEHASKKGKCGALAVARLQGKLSLLGVHVSGSPKEKIGFIEYISRSDIESMFTKFEFVAPNMPDKPTFSVPEVLTLTDIPEKHVMYKFLAPECGFGVLGMFTNSKGKQYRSGKAKSNVVAIPGFVDTYDPKRIYGPPKFGGFMHEGNWVSNTEEKLKIYVEHDFSTDPNLTDLAGEIMVARALKEVPSLQDAKPLTLVETINGVTATEIKRIKDTTSAGCFLPGNKERYNEVISLADPTKVSPNSVIIDNLCAIHDAYDRNESANFTFGWSEKDEPIKQEKTLKGGTRIFNPSPYSLLLLMRQYFSPIVSRLQADKWTFAHKVGVNCVSRDWDKIARYLVDPSEGFHDGRLEPTDQKTFDPRVELYAAFLDIVKIAQALPGYKSHHISVMKKLAYDASHVILNIDGCAVYMATGSQSGGFETAFFNSWCLEKLEMMAYWIAARKYLKSTTPWRELVRLIPNFRDVCRLIVYGDDVIINKSELIPWYTIQERVAAFKELGFHVTSDVKGEDPRPKMLNECSFLKRAFRYDLERQRWACPLEMTSIYKSLAYEMGHEALTDCAYSTALVDNACREFFQHGRDIYASETEKLKGAILRLPASWRPDYDIPSYDDLLARGDDGLFTKDM